jgi:hypothetical protein
MASARSCALAAQPWRWPRTPAGPRRVRQLPALRRATTSTAVTGQRVVGTARHGCHVACTVAPPTWQDGPTTPCPPRRPAGPRPRPTASASPSAFGGARPAPPHSAAPQQHRWAAPRCTRSQRAKVLRARACPCIDQAEGGAGSVAAGPSFHTQPGRARRQECGQRLHLPAQPHCRSRRARLAASQPRTVDTALALLASRSPAFASRANHCQAAALPSRPAAHRSTSVWPGVAVS